ncbi:MAG: hypothetical protein ACI4V1_05790 [Eubacteriales bacterium]
MNNIRRTRDIVSIKRTIASNYDKFRSLSLFFHERKAVLDKIVSLPEEEIAKIAAECREGGVRWRAFAKYMNKIEGALLTGEVVDRSQSEDCAIPDIDGVPVKDFLHIHETPSGVNLSFEVNGLYDVYAKMNRNGCFEVSGMNVTPQTEFTVVNELNTFWEDRYSLALKSERLSFAVSVEDPKTGKKGGACARIYVFRDGTLTVDDLSKYMDTSALTLWIAP